VPFVGRVRPRDAKPVELARGMPASHTCQMSPVLLRAASRTMLRVGTASSGLAKRSRRTPVACRLKIAKLTPSPRGRAPSGKGTPDRTACTSHRPSSRSSSASASAVRAPARDASPGAGGCVDIEASSGRRWLERPSRRPLASPPNRSIRTRAIRDRSTAASAIRPVARRRCFRLIPTPFGTILGRVKRATTC
jgi:hypothetical protein